MQRIVALATETARLGIGAAFLLDDYERLSEDDRSLLPDPYGLGLTACIAKTARRLHQLGIVGAVDYIFESGDRGQGSTKRALEEVFAISDKKKKFAFNSLSFGSKAEFPGLQLADVLAYETGRFVPLALGWDSSPERKCFQALRERNEHYAMLFDFDELTKQAANQRRRRR